MLGGGLDDRPSQQGGLVNLGAILYEPPPPGVPAAGVDTTVDLDGDHVGGPREIEAPLAVRVEYQFCGWFWEAYELGQYSLVQGAHLLRFLGLFHDLLGFRVLAE
ncbi:hypothetical protein [Aeromonas salmonicida]|uniref:hypothetical protein n=1 Tax=Aeromonas salmonicida TaxID=645 RepID=UPI0014780ADE|nr:hypothetical protein [Aeromonas salmonicida]